MAPKITLRPDELTQDTEVLLHFGNGDRRSIQKVSKEVVDRHDYWVGVIDRCGRFAVSVYALVGIDEEVIAREMPHRVYGRSTVGEIRNAGFELVASTVEMDRMPPGLSRIQPWHSTVFLRTPGHEGVLAELSVEVAKSIVEVQPELEVLFSLFERVPNLWSDRSDP
jgi:hypothetical protein